MAWTCGKHVPKPNEPLISLRNQPAAPWRHTHWTCRVTIHSRTRGFPHPLYMRPETRPQVSAKINSVLPLPMHKGSSVVLWLYQISTDKSGQGRAEKLNKCTVHTGTQRCRFFYASQSLDCKEMWRGRDRCSQRHILIKSLLTAWLDSCCKRVEATSAGLQVSGLKVCSQNWSCVECVVMWQHVFRHWQAVKQRLFTASGRDGSSKQYCDSHEMMKGETFENDLNSWVVLITVRLHFLFTLLYKKPISAAVRK